MGVCIENLNTMFDYVNEKAGEIASTAGQTPGSFNSSIMDLVRNLSNNVMVPIAGLILTYVLVYELISMVVEKNHGNEFSTGDFFKYIFKMVIGVELVTHTLDITLAFFDVGQYIVNKASSVISNSTAIDASATMNSLVAGMQNLETSELFMLAIETMIVSFFTKILSVIITTIMFGRMIEIYLYVSVSPVPFSTLTNREWGTIGTNYIREVEEPFFIKNLETVQGDERDTIIFSVGYAKDSNGRLMHNFGPLNRMGGERRLNVAVTRAKHNVQLVASIHHTDIDLSRTSANGARLLKEYLDFAENGNIALERTVSVDPFEQFDSEFELEVCDFLREKGYTVDTQVGCSSFRIDLAVKKPDSSDYVIAIECDGATYHSSKNARDRDRLRQQILESMGWKFYRIWSTDWFKNGAIERDRLLTAVKKAFMEEKAFEAMPTNAVKDETEEVANEFETESSDKTFEFPKYKMVDTWSLGYSISSCQRLVREVLEVEAPLSEDWLLKRIVWMFNRDKVTSVVRRDFDDRMYGCERNGIIRRNGFLYLKDQSNYAMRVPSSDDTKRDIMNIAREELAAGLLAVIEQNVTVDKDGLFKFIAKELGFQRVADNIYYKLDDALSLLSSFVNVEGNTISLIK